MAASRDVSDHEIGRKAAACSECGAPLPPSGACQEHFQNLLFMESEVVGAPGGIAHYYAVASYGLQHPQSMGYTVEAVEGLRTAVSDVLHGRASIEEVLRRTRKAARAAGRVTRRDGDRIPHWPVAAWPMTVTDILAGGIDDYCNRVKDWANSVVDSIGESHA